MSHALSHLGLTVLDHPMSLSYYLAFTKITVDVPILHLSLASPISRFPQCPTNTCLRSHLAHHHLVITSIIHYISTPIIYSSPSHLPNLCTNFFDLLHIPFLFSDLYNTRIHFKYLI